MAIATAVTVFIIALAYNQVIELFPTGGGGYRVATKLVGPYLGPGLRLRADPRLRADDRDLDRVRRRCAGIAAAARLPAVQAVGRGVLHRRC